MSPDRLQPGTLFANDYEILRPLAEGGMGAVYVARQRSTGKERALKVLLPSVVSDARNREAFEREARVGGLIESAHVVEVVGAGIDDATGTPWLAMELLKGETLGARVARDGAMSPGDTAALFEQLGDALGRAHAAGVVHRDLKPDNVFIVPSPLKGIPFVVKVLDFGISKLISANRTAATSTRAIGSPLWLAPEQTETSTKLRPSTDVWSLGLLAFWCLTGRSFWKTARAPEASITALLMEITLSPIPVASARAAELGVSPPPPGFDAWFARCVARDPADRYADASAATPALLELLAPPKAPSPGAHPRTVAMQAPPPQIPRTEAMPAFAAPGVVLGMPPARPSRELPAAPARKGPSADVLVPAGLALAVLIAGVVWNVQRPDVTPAHAHAADASAQGTPLPAAPERRLPSGVLYRELVAGAGAHPGPTDRVTVHYRGTLLDGTEFDSSYGRGAPSTFPLNRVIRCWTEGLQQMATGGRARLECPPDTAYGERAMGSTIPANSTLRFEVELIRVDPG